jgi:putative peptidoglycan lipid II flippase
MSRILRAAFIVMIGFGLAKVTALFRQRIIAGVIGASGEADAYFAAFTAPDLIFMLISGGALATAFIPIFSEYISKGEEQRAAAWRMASNVLTVSLLISLVAATLAAITAPFFVPALIVPGLTPENQALTVELMRVILISTVIFSISGLITGVLHTLQHFLMPAFAPAIYNVGIIFGAMFLVPDMGIMGLAWGSVIGALLHLGVQLPILFMRRTQLRPLVDWRDPGLRKVAILMAPRAAALGLIYSKFIIRTNLASNLPEGSVSALDYAWDLMQLPETLFATAVATAVFPTLAELASQEERQKLADAYNYGLRTILTLTIPAAVGVLMLSLPIVRAFYERGEFTLDASMTVSNALNFFAFGIVGHGMLEIVARLFYARKDTLRPLMAAAVMVVVTFIISWLTIGTLGVGGIALADTVGVFVESLILIWWLRDQLPQAISRLTQKTTLQVIGASALMAGSIYLWLTFIGERNLYLVAGGGILVGAAVFVGAALLLGIEEVKQMPRLLLRRT